MQKPTLLLFLLLAGSATAQERVAGPAAIRAAARETVQAAPAPSPRTATVGSRRPVITDGLRITHPRYLARHAPRRVWVRGAFEERPRTVWVPERVERVWVEPVHGWRSDYRLGRVRVVLRAGYHEEVVHPAHWETRTVTVWVPGHWRRL